MDDKFTCPKPNHPPRRSDALRSKGREASVVKGKKRRGRHRRGRSMGRYPFLTYAKRYLETVGKMYAEATMKELDRRLRRMDKDFRALKDSGAIGTTDPTKMAEKEIAAYLGLLRERGLSESGQVHNVSTLKAVLVFCGNTVLERMRITHGHMLPKRRKARLPAIDASVVDLVHKRAMNVSGWRMTQAYTLVVLAMNTGLRTKEMRLARVCDLDRNSWRLIVRHPKGEGRYGTSRAVPVHPKARSLLNRYLEMRDEAVSRRSPMNEALFPALSDKDDGYHSTNGIEILKQMVEDDVGARFDLRACRRTFGQSCIDNNVPLDSVSLIMGHGSTKTTESYYCRKREEVALREMSDSWQSEIPQSAKTSLIENKEYLSGYA